MDEELTRYAKGLAKELGISLFYDARGNPFFEKMQGKIVTQVIIRRPFDKWEILDAAQRVCVKLEAFRVSQIIKEYEQAEDEG